MRHSDNVEDPKPGSPAPDPRPPELAMQKVQHCRPLARTSAIQAPTRNLRERLLLLKNQCGALEDSVFNSEMTKKIAFRQKYTVNSISKAVTNLARLSKN